MLAAECEAFLRGAGDRPERRQRSIAENREDLERAVRALAGEVPDVYRSDETLDGVPVRVYIPDGPSRNGVCVFAHGGGWALGSIDTHDEVCAMLSAVSGCRLVSVEYRRPPEHPYPAALDDVATVAIAVSAGRLGGASPTRIGLAGDSAGGNLAAAASLRLKGTVPLAFLMLLLPVLDNRPERYLSYRLFAEGYGLTADDMVWYFEQYAGPAWRRLDDEELVPMRAASLEGLPRTMVVTAENDVLRDEAEAFVRHLTQADVPAELVRVPGAFHPFHMFPSRLACARTTLQRCGIALGVALNEAPTDGS